MYIDPFVAGVVSTVFSELIILVIVAIFKTTGGKR